MADTDAAQDTSTISSLPALDPSDPAQRSRLRRYQLVRRAGLVVLLVVVLLGASSLLGVRSRTVSSSAGGYELEVTYAQVARPALAVPWRVVVHAENGFDGPVVLATTSSYFDLFDENGLSPEIASGTSNEAVEFLEFDPPPGDTLEVSFDARIGPNVQWGKTARTTLIVGDRRVTEVEYRTWIVP